MIGSRWSQLSEQSVDMSKSYEETETEGSLPLFTVDGAHATIRLNRPKQHNRIEPQDLLAIYGHLQRISADKSIDLLILTGTGRKTFSSGYSLNALDAGTVSAPDSPSVTLESVINMLEDLNVPTVCALNGSVYGAATDFALACDFRFGITGSTMLMPAAKIGIHYYAHGMRRYVERLGLGAAKRLFMTAEKIGCDEMLRIGFLDAVVEPSDLECHVESFVKRLENLAPTAVRGMKHDLNLIARGQFDECEMNRGYDRSLQSEDLAEGLAAHSEKRSPMFRKDG